MEKRDNVISSSLKPGDEVRVYAGESIPRDGLVIEGKTFVDESMMTGETNPIFKEKDDHVIGGTRVTSDNIIVEITAEAGKSFLDQMVGMIKNATRPKTQNEIALTILLAGLSIIFITVIGALLFLGYFLGYKDRYCIFSSTFSCSNAHYNRWIYFLLLVLPVLQG